jgi:GNAT superfamily N-acetyltransferase
MSETAPSRTTATCECGRDLAAGDYEALVATFVEHVDDAHADWKVGEMAVRNFLEALDRLTGPTERLEQIGAIEVHAATGAHIDDALRFFDHDAFADNAGWASCYCMYNQVEAATWAERSARQNRADLDTALRTGTTTAVVASVDGHTAGWCNASLRRAYPARRDGSADDDRVGVIMCFAVAPPYRGHGVARRLLDAAVEQLAGAGAVEVEAYPLRDPSEASSAYHGTVSMFTAAGFDLASEEGNNVVMRKVLA